MSVIMGPRVISEHQDKLVRIAEVAGLDDKQFRALIYMATLGYDENQPAIPVAPGAQLKAVEIFSATLNALAGNIGDYDAARLSGVKELLRGMIDTHLDDANTFEIKKKYSDPDPSTYPGLPTDSDFIQRSAITDALEKLGIRFVDSRPLPLWANPLAMREMLFGAIAAENGDGPVRPLSPQERRAALKIVADKSAKLET